MTTLALPLAMLPAMTSCNTTSSDPNTLNIICYTAGYGSEWIEEIKEEFLLSHPDVKVDIKAIYEAQQLIESHLGSSRNDDDLYISVSASWKSYAAQGAFAPLDDFLNETVDGVTIKEKVSDEFEDSIYFTKSDGSKHSYRLPWTAGMGGIYYNKVMFENNNWDDWLKDTYSTNSTGLPETFEQLLALCQKINGDRLPAAGDGLTAIKPFAYSGTNTDYFDYGVFNWWAQIAGVDAIKEFLKYESSDNYDVTKNETYNALKTATERWNDIFSNPNNYIANSNNKSAADAQKEFINGYAAMMFNGDWLYNESLQYSSTPSFKLGMMKTPVLSEANANYVNSSYTIGEDQYIAIPATSKRQDLAKDFIKAIISDKGCQTFINKAHGFLAYDTDYSKISTEDEFMNEILQLKQTNTNKFTSFSNNRKYLCNYIDIWCTSALRPFLGVLNGTQTSIDNAFSSISSTATSQWGYWTKQSQ